MNCKPGDLAVRVSAFGDSIIPIGAIVRCVLWSTEPTDYRSWAGSSVVCGLWDVEWRGTTTDARGLILAVPDEHLRPIRDPGDDARDETLEWLPVPSRDEVTS